MLQGARSSISVSIGIVMGAERYRRAEDMIRDADTAMYRAKALGKARCEVFDTSMLAAAEERLQLESDLRHALERERIRRPLPADRLAGRRAAVRASKRCCAGSTPRAV